MGQNTRPVKLLKFGDGRDSISAPLSPHASLDISKCPNHNARESVGDIPNMQHRLQSSNSPPVRKGALMGGLGDVFQSIHDRSIFQNRSRKHGATSGD
jgi:hypothetical protein